MEPLWCLILIAGLAIPCQSDDGTDGKSIDSVGLIKLGRKLHKPVLTLIGMAIQNLHECSQWTSWSPCDATSIGYFGNRKRTRTCFNRKNKLHLDDDEDFETELDFEVCEGRCKDDYNLTSNDNCLKFIVEPATYDGAVEKCISEGSFISRIDSVEKYNDVLDMIKGYGSRIYIAGTRESVSSDWDENFPGDYVEWLSGQPSDGSDELCLYLHEDDRLLADIACGNKYAFVCELAL